MLIRRTRAPFCVAAVIPLTTLAMVLWVLLAFGSSGLARAATISAGDILVGDIATGAIVAVDPTTGAQTIAASGGLLVAPWGLGASSTGELYVVDNGSLASRIIEIDLATGAQRLVTTLTNSFFSWSMDLVVEQSGDLVVADHGNGRIVRIDPATGAETVVTGPNVPTGLPRGIAFDTTGDLIFTRFGAPVGATGGVLVVPPTGGFPTTIANGLAAPGRVAVTPNGEIYVTTSTNTVGEVDRSTGGFSSIVGTSSTWGILADSDGSLLLSRAAGLSRLDPVSGNIVSVSAGGLLSAGRDLEFAPITFTVAEPSTAVLAMIAIAAIVGIRRFRRG